jgi:hypothetical protein
MGSSVDGMSRLREVCGCDVAWTGSSVDGMSRGLGFSWTECFVDGNGMLHGWDVL